MSLDGMALKQFYKTSLGQLSQQCILAELNHFCDRVSDNKRILGFGYVLPYMDLFFTKPSKSRSVQIAIPTRMKQENYLVNRKNITTFIDEQNWPFPESFYDQIIMIHGLEEADSITLLLKECYRALAPKGEFILITPNRTSIWSRSEKTPFSSGQPFTKSQIEKKLLQSGFSVEQSCYALFFPPINMSHKAWKYLEIIGKNFWPALGGVILTKASKHILAISGKHYYQRQFIPA